MTIRVLLADDHAVVRSGCRRLLEQTGEVEVVAEAADANAAYAAFVERAPDVVVTDLSMAGDGQELLRRVLQRDASARVLVFSMHDGAALVRHALAAGARGFLTKASSPDCLLDAVRALHGGRRYLGPDLSPALLSEQPDAEQERIAALSAREFAVFRLLAEGHSVAACAKALNLSPKTVANHQTLIREKLGVETSAALTHVALRQRVIGLPI